MTTQFSHEFYMNEALQEAQKALQYNEVPVGAVIVNAEGVIISRAYNLRESRSSATAHAEVLAIEAACKALSSWRLIGCTLYVTLEPCFMCAGAVLLARIPTVVFGAKDPKMGAVQSLASVLNDARLNHSCDIVSGICTDECAELLKNFFKSKRKSRNLLERNSIES